MTFRKIRFILLQGTFDLFSIITRNLSATENCDEYFQLSARGRKKYDSEHSSVVFQVMNPSNLITYNYFSG